MGHHVTGHAAPGHQQVVHLQRHHAAIGHLKVAPGAGQDQHRIAVHELGEDANRISELGLFADIVTGEVVAANDLARIAHTQGHGEIAQLGFLEAGHHGLECHEGLQRLLAALHFGTGQVVHIGGVEAVHMRQVQVVGLARVRQRGPGAAQVGAVLRDHAQCAGLVELLVQIGAAQGLFLAGGLLLPGAAPVGVGGRLLLGVLQKALFIDARGVEHRGHAQHLVLGRHAVTGTGQVGDVGVPRAVNDALGQHHLAARFALGDDALQGPTSLFKNHIHRIAVQDRAYAGLAHQVVGHYLEEVGVQAFAVVVGPLHSAAHGGGAAFHLHAYAFGFDGALVAVPGQGLHAHGGDGAAKAAIALQQHHIGASPACGQGGGQSGRTGAHHQHFASGQNRQGFGSFDVHALRGIQRARRGRCVLAHLTLGGALAREGQALAAPALKHACDIGNMARVFVVVLHGAPSKETHSIRRKRLLGTHAASTGRRQTSGSRLRRNDAAARYAVYWFFLAISLPT